MSRLTTAITVLSGLGTVAVSVGLALGHASASRAATGPVAPSASTPTSGTAERPEAAQQGDRARARHTQRQHHAHQRVPAPLSPTPSAAPTPVAPSQAPANGSSHGS